MYWIVLMGHALVNAVALAHGGEYAVLISGALIGSACSMSRMCK